MNYYILAETLGTVGTIIIAYTAISVHRRVREEHKIDDRVFKYMRKEQTVACIGITMVLIEYVIKLYANLA